MKYFVSSARSYFLVVSAITILLRNGCVGKDVTAESEKVAEGHVDAEQVPRIGLYAAPNHGHQSGPLGGNQAFYAATLPEYGHGSANPQVAAQSPQKESPASPGSPPAPQSNYGSYTVQQDAPQTSTEAPASTSPYGSYYGGSHAMPPTLAQPSVPYGASYGGSYGAVYGTAGHANGHEMLPTLAVGGPNDFPRPMNNMNEDYGHAVPYGAYGTLSKPMMNPFPVRYGDGYVSTSYGALMQQLGGGYGAGVTVNQAMPGGYGSYGSGVTVGQGMAGGYSSYGSGVSVNQGTPVGPSNGVAGNQESAGGYGSYGSYGGYGSYGSGVAATAADQGISTQESPSSYGSYGNYGNVVASVSQTPPNQESPSSYGSYGSYGNVVAPVSQTPPNQESPSSYGSYGSYGNVVAPVSQTPPNQETPIKESAGGSGSYGSYGSYGNYGNGLAANQVTPNQIPNKESMGGYGNYGSYGSYGNYDSYGSGVAVNQESASSYGNGAAVNQAPNHGSSVIDQGVAGGYGSYGHGLAAANQGMAGSYGSYGQSVPVNPVNGGGYYVQGFVKIPVPEEEPSHEFESGPNQGSNQFNQVLYHY